MKIRKDDVVKVIAGADRGKQGRVIRTMPGTDMIFVEKVRLVKRHKKQVQGQAGGGIVEMEAAIHVSNVKVVSKASRQ